MNWSQAERFHRLIPHPPTSSKIAAAKEFGVDLPLTVRKLSPTNLRLPVLSLEGLIRSKRARGRTKDLLILPELEALKELLTSSRTKPIQASQKNPASPSPKKSSLPFQGHAPGMLATPGCRA